jgi:hypothetical protein
LSMHYVAGNLVLLGDKTFPVVHWTQLFVLQAWCSSVLFLETPSLAST